MKIAIYAQNTVMAGRQNVSDDWEIEEADGTVRISDDVTVYEGSRDEIREQIRAIADAHREPNNSSDMHMRKVARALAEAIGDDDPFAENRATAQGEDR